MLLGGLEVFAKILAQEMLDRLFTITLLFVMIGVCQIQGFHMLGKHLPHPQPFLITYLMETGTLWTFDRPRSSLYW